MRKAGVLTPRERRFVAEYLIDCNASAAALRAGYAKQTYGANGSQLLEKPLVAEAIAKAEAKRAAKTGITADRVLKELARIGFSDLGTYLSFDQDGVHLNDSSQVDTRALAEVSERPTRTGKTVTIKLHDKVSALTKLGQHLGLFAEKVELTGKDGGPIAITDFATLAQRAVRAPDDAPAK